MEQQFQPMPFFGMWGWNQTASGQNGPADPQKMWQQILEQQRAGWEQMQNYFRSMQSFWPMPQNMRDMQTNWQQWEAFCRQWMEAFIGWNQTMQAWFLPMPIMKMPGAPKADAPGENGGKEEGAAPNPPAFQLPRPDPKAGKDPLKLLIELLELSYEKPVEGFFSHFRKAGKGSEKPGLPMNMNMKKLMAIAKILFDGSEVDYDYEE